MKFQRVKKMAQKGFTLVELIVVIVIIGILAAVALPRLSSSSEAAHGGVQQATLGALKTAWSIAYGKAKANPDIGQVLAEMSDPTCTGTAASFTCTNVFQYNGTTQATYTATLNGASKVASPASISILNGGTLTP